MAEPQDDGLRGPRDKISHNIAIHRINDFLLGHIGQLFYKPVDDEDVEIGYLGSNRKSEQLHGPVATGGAQPTFQGLWCSDGTAISQLKFATKLKQRDPLRWLIVQKRSSTTIFEPEIRAKPVENTVSMLSIDVGGEEHIAANPIVTLTTSDTGGDIHCDFSINLGLDDDAPQIAIIDRSGNWSVWYSERERHGITRTTKAIPKNKGNWDLPPSSGLTNGTGFMEESFRINWAAELRKADDWERDSNASDNSRVLPNTLLKAYLAGLDTTQSRFERKKLLRDAEKAFVIPDIVEEDKQLSVIRPEEGVINHDTLQLRSYLVKVVEEINRGFFGQSASESMGSIAVDPFGPIQEALGNREADDHAALKPLLSFSQIWQPLDLPEVDVQWDAQLRQLQKSSSIQLFECGRYGSRLGVLEFFEAFSVNWSARLPAESLKPVQWRYIELVLERMAAEVYLSEKGVYRVPPSTMELALKALPRERNSQVSIEDDVEDLPHSQPRSDAVLPTPSATPSSSRATSEAADHSQKSEEDEEQQEEDPAVTRLRMYLPSIKFTPPAKQGQSRVLSFWPEQRGSDPAEYKYSPTGKPDAESEAAKRRRQRDEERRRRRAERRAQIGVKMERSGEAFSQPLMPSFIRSSPPPQMFANSQAPMRSSGFDSQQSQGQSQSFGFSQTMSQPLPGEFGTRESRLRKKAKAKKKAQIGFR
ncbi:hypothetical protein VP1G_06018 [Cytospora mali]|uniref:Uncharacterized protein n=1 Tax=Cytospora mali TaxID=578113 RepID=A0A194V4K8_CYTMA|nr:hypothetical protein VP1G_06018 [Valsa mali var. pyri (nom. inval.)]